MNTSAESRASDWLIALRPALAPVTDADLAALNRLEDDLACLLARRPVGGDVEPGRRSERLRQIRTATAASGQLSLAVPSRHGGSGRPAVMQALMQFICGYYDVDLRDSTGLGHGRLIAEHASPAARDRWVPRLLDGAISGIAVTEPHGGSQVHATRTRATPSSVPLLREHFAGYRPLVTATALGAAAGCHDRTVAALEARRRSGNITSLRDNALITIGRSYAEINAALLAACTAVTLAESGSPLAARWGCAVKAYGVDAAYRAVSELALLAGASGFISGCATAKAVRDLNALLYADGIHDSLYRAAGRTLAAQAADTARIPPPRLAALASA